MGEAGEQDRHEPLKKDGQATAFATSWVEKRREHFSMIASALFFFGEVTFQ
jgi:hypothetical protein